MTATILLAEDEPILRMDVKEMLEEAGYQVVGEAGDGEKAIEMTYRLEPDLIIMDIKMPRLNGLKASKILSRSHQTPILLLTAYSQRDFIEEAKQPNIHGYLVKPISESNLIPAVEIVLSQAVHFQKYRDQVGSLQQQLSERKQIEKAKGLLMKVKGLSEEDAFKMMRTRSMNHQQSLGKTAQLILKKYGGKKQKVHNR
jgi:response regulator NasT